MKIYKLIPLYQTYDSLETNLIKSILESEKIYYYINTNDANNVLPQLGLTQVGNQILVSEENFHKAKFLIEKFHNQSCSE